MANELHGTGVALVTPLKEDRSIDFDGLERLIDHVIDGGVDYLVSLGTTGESPVFSWDEKMSIISHTLEYCHGRKPVVLGLGGNSTQEILEKLPIVAHLKAVALLSVSPYYNRPSQEGIKHHYTQIARASEHPIILYNVPFRTASNIDSDTTLALAEVENIIGIKDATHDMLQVTRVARDRPEGFLLLSGEDSLALPAMSIGAEGVISVLANLLPHEYAQMIEKAGRNDFKGASAHHRRLSPFYHLSTAEGNPSSIKTGLSAAGIVAPYVRSPLAEGSKLLEAQFKIALEDLKATNA